LLVGLDVGLLVGLAVGFGVGPVLGFGVAVAVGFADVLGFADVDGDGLLVADAEADAFAEPDALTDADADVDPDGDVVGLALVVADGEGVGVGDHEGDGGGGGGGLRAAVAAPSTVPSRLNTGLGAGTMPSAIARAPNACGACASDTAWLRACTWSAYFDCSTWSWFTANEPWARRVLTTRTPIRPAVSKPDTSSTKGVRAADFRGCTTRSGTAGFRRGAGRRVGSR
jgi:hypothetical protein